MTVPQPPDELGVELAAAEEQLVEQLEEACALQPEEPGDESTGELVRLEDALLGALKATEHTIALRTRRKKRVGTGAGESAEGVRQFVDRSGRGWRAWAVVPGRAQSRYGAERHLGEYQKGWLAFESLDGSSRRRLPNYPSDWHTRDNAALTKLLESATPVARRPPGPTRGPDAEKRD